MKHPEPRDKQDLFKGSLRHYHRSGSDSRNIWDEWIDGKSSPSNFKKRLKTGLILIAVLALGAIIVGLIIELR